MSRLHDDDDDDNVKFAMVGNVHSVTSVDVQWRKYFVMLPLVSIYRKEFPD